MPIPIPRTLVEFILLGPEDDRRQLQDSPILGEVWLEYAANPGKALELLITPYKEHAAGAVAAELASHEETADADIAYLQGIVAAKLTFEQVLRFVVPLTSWWNDKRNAAAMGKYSATGAIEADIALMVQTVRNGLDKTAGAAMQDQETGRRFMALAGLLLWAQQTLDQPPADLPTEGQVRWILDRDVAGPAAAQLRNVLPFTASAEAKSLVWTISQNRRASPALTMSVSAVKGDAARKLFTVSCKEIVWAVIDSGIDATHGAFRKPKDAKEGKEEGTRVDRAFDFTIIRDLVSLDNERNANKRAACIAKLSKPRRKRPLNPEKTDEKLQQLAKGAREGRSINWETVEELVEIEAQDPDSLPPTNHGTHVAGIIAASKDLRKPEEDETDWADGMCPDIRLYDFRVLAPTLGATEFAVIAALQYIRYINERNSYMTVHGANLSLSIPHDVRNYACGRTPVCNECERLVNSGVVVVAAAGNRGYQNFETKEGLYESYAAFSITDPGNADGVITVGATHRFWPHTYGVSFFSSRGPTGDGRLKPDLVAPGERIRAPLPRNQWGDLDGTSMASPHVSGAAAMLMARYSELVGQPRRIKDILCKSATDLGRERSFQGHGMLDVLRAFQSI